MVRDGCRRGGMDIEHLEPGTHWGPNARFEIVELLESGPSVCVYAAVDHLIPEDHVQVIMLKILKPWSCGVANQDVAVESFRREVMILKELDHPHIPLLIAQGEFEGFSWVVYELLFGAQTLMSGAKNRYGDGPVGLSDLFIPVASALEHAHRKGVVHEGLSSSTVMIEPYGDGTFYVCLVGWASARRMGDNLTHHFAAPSAGPYRGGLVDPRDDQYRLAAIMARMVLGMGWAETLQPHNLLADTERLRMFPWEMRVALVRALSERREDRFSSIEQFMREGFLPYATPRDRGWFEDRAVDERAAPGTVSRSTEKEITETESSPSSPPAVRAAAFITIAAAVAKAVWEIIGL